MKKTTSRRKFIGRGIGWSGGLLATARVRGSAPDSGAPNETLKIIHGLRTIHGDFSDKQVSDASIKLVVDASVRAANASGLQTYSIVVIRDAAKMRKLTGYRASCMLLYSVDYTRLIDTANHLGYQFHADNMESFITGSTNTILAAQTGVIAAKSLEIDSLLTNGIHRGDMERIWETLDLPQKSCYPLIALMLGYPKQEPPYAKGRLNGPGVVHSERFHKLSASELDEIVRQYDDKALHLGLNEDWGKGGHKHYLDWLHKEWLRSGKPTASETQMLRRLKKSGFVEPQGA